MMMSSVGDVEDIRWLVCITSFEEEWSEGRENKSSGWEWMAYFRVHETSRRKWTLVRTSAIPGQ